MLSMQSGCSLVAHRHLLLLREGIMKRAKMLKIRNHFFMQECARGRNMNFFMQKQLFTLISMRFE